MQWEACSSLLSSQIILYTSKIDPLLEQQTESPGSGVILQLPNLQKLHSWPEDMCNFLSLHFKAQCQCDEIGVCLAQHNILGSYHLVSCNCHWLHSICSPGVIWPPGVTPMLPCTKATLPRSPSPLWIWFGCFPRVWDESSQHPNLPFHHRHSGLKYSSL